MIRAVPCRLFLVFAAAAPVAVVLRRGPSRWVEVVKWHTDSDLFEPGQWLHGRIIGARCGLSADGRYFVYFATRYGSRSGPDTWTAVSRPPWLTALKLWPSGDMWHGGGRFDIDGTLQVDGSPRPPETIGPLRVMHRPVFGVDADRTFRPDAPADGADWHGQDPAGRRILTRAGALYRCDEKGAETLLRDFNADRFDAVAAPEWALCW